jgi:hypothetical protein
LPDFLKPSFYKRLPEKILNYPPQAVSPQEKLVSKWKRWQMVTEEIFFPINLKYGFLRRNWGDEPQ